MFGFYFFCTCTRSDAYLEEASRGGREGGREGRNKIKRERERVCVKETSVFFLRVWKFGHKKRKDEK